MTKVLDPSFGSCKFDEYENNINTSKYCSLKNQLENKTDFNKRIDSYNCIPFYMFGTFVIIVSSLIACSIYMLSKRREVLAFQAQQVMPIAQEGIEKMVSTVGKAELASKRNGSSLWCYC